MTWVEVSHSFGIYQCSVCGIKVVEFRDDTTTIHHDCRPRPFSPAKVPGLGDRVERVLKRIGIKPCRGCRRRRNKLNRLGEAIAKPFRSQHTDTPPPR